MAMRGLGDEAGRIRWLVYAPGHDAAPGHIDSITIEVIDEDWYAEILDGTG